MEEIILNLIMHSGEARSYAMEALQLAKAGKFKEARETIMKANDELGHAHNAQANLIKGESDGKKTEVSLLLVHAQDHLMTVMLLRDIVKNFVNFAKKIG